MGRNKKMAFIPQKVIWLSTVVASEGTTNLLAFSVTITPDLLHFLATFCSPLFYILFNKNVFKNEGGFN